MGRYVGQTHTDLKEVFEADDEIQKVIKADTDDDTEDDDKKTDDDKIKDDDGKLIKIIPVTPVKKTKPDSKLDTDVKQTKSGDLRPVNQAVGMADRGNLRNATSLVVKQKSLNQNAFFEMMESRNQSFYGTFEIAELVARLGARVNQQMDRKIYVSAVSKLKGGSVGSHKSHQNGIDADIGYPTADRVKFPVVVEGNRNYNKRSYSIEKTYDLFKFAFKQPDIKIDRVFVDRIIIKELCQYAKAKGELAGNDKELVQTMFKKLDHYTGHGDHFHIRLKCSSADPACQDKAYFVNPGCS